MMMKKKLLWLIPSCALILIIGFLSFRYAGLPKIPQDDPTEIVAVYAAADGDITYHITNETLIKTVMVNFRSIRFHRTVDLKPEIFREIGGIPSFQKIQFQYGDNSLIYTRVSSNHFNLRFENKCGKKQLFKAKHGDFQVFESCFKEACGIPTNPL